MNIDYKILKEEHLPFIDTGWWFGTWLLFFHSVGNVIIPTDFHSIIFQRAWWLNHQPAIVNQ